MLCQGKRATCRYLGHEEGEKSEDCCRKSPQMCKRGQEVCGREPPALGGNRVKIPANIRLAKSYLARAARFKAFRGLDSELHRPPDPLVCVAEAGALPRYPADDESGTIQAAGRGRRRTSPALITPASDASRI